MNAVISVLLVVLGVVCVLGLVAVVAIAVEMFASQHRREHRIQHPR